jgi:hypothetical protein
MRLAERQRRFAAHLRDPEHVAAPSDVEPRRMAVYRELFLANVAGLLAGSFPVTHRILGIERWNRLVRGFYSTHHAHTPYFLELPCEFVEWLRARGGDAGDEPPFLEELAHYEWVELALAISEAEPPVPGAPGADPFDTPLVVSALAWPLAYRWPVHRLGPAYQPADAPAAMTFLVVYRDAADEVRFLEIGPLAAALLKTLERDPGLTGRQALEGIPNDAGIHAIPAARDALATLQRCGVLCAAAG